MLIIKRVNFCIFHIHRNTHVIHHIKNFHKLGLKWPFFTLILTILKFWELRLLIILVRKNIQKSFFIFLVSKFETNFLFFWLSRKLIKSLLDHPRYKCQDSFSPPFTAISTAVKILNQPITVCQPNVNSHLPIFEFVLSQLKCRK